MVIPPVLLAFVAATSTVGTSSNPDGEVQRTLQEELERERQRAGGAPALEPMPGPSAPTAPALPKEPPAEDKSFIKGDLIHIGTRELFSRYDHVGVRVGPRFIGKDLFLGVAPTGAYYGRDWGFGLQVPLNLLLLEAGTWDFGGARIRSEDWDEVPDFARVVRFITFGRKESNLYFTVTNLRPTTLGHGQLIRNYQPNIDIDRSMTGATFEAYNDWGGFQLQANDVTFQNQMVGGLLFAKPLAFLDNPIVRSISLGVEYAADFKAPRCVQVSKEDRRCVPGGGNMAGVDPLTGQSRDDTFVRTDPTLGRPLTEETTVQAYGLSAEVKFLKNDAVDLKAYGTFHHFIGADSGLATGVLGRMNVGDQMISAFRTRAEFRTFAAHFRPEYFDTLYEISKYQFIQASNPYQIAPTKYQAVFGDPERGFSLADTDQRLGYNVEASWGLFDGPEREKRIAFGFGLSDSTGPNDTNFYAHLELPVIRYMQLFATFLRVNATDLAGIVEPSFENAVALGGLRVQILPFFFINTSYQASFQIIRGAGREFHLGNDNVIDENGATSPFFSENHIYETAHTLAVDLEIGWEFKD